ncbi:MAG: DoxX family protein [Patescibacteria group bacterium]
MPFLLALHSYADWGLLALRLALAAIFWVHGRSKAGMWKMQPSAQMPAKTISIMKLLSICEPLGALAMVVGFLTQPAALGFSLIMLGAIHSKKNVWKTPFKADDKTGWEFDLLILAASLFLLLAGAGAFSLDRLLFRL